VRLEEVLVELAVEALGRLMLEFPVDLVIKLLQVAGVEAVEEIAVPAKPGG
jgi:hypothetical protein